MFSKDKDLHNVLIKTNSYKGCPVKIYQMYGKYGKFYNARVMSQARHAFVLVCSGTSLWILQHKYERWIDLFATELKLLSEGIMTFDQFKAEAENCNINNLVADLIEEVRDKANSNNVRKESRKCDATLQAEAEAAVYNSINK